MSAANRLGLALAAAEREKKRRTALAEECSGVECVGPTENGK